MNERELRVATRDGEMRTFVVHPDREGPFPVAVLYMDGVGYRKQIKAHARCFAAAGHYCVAPDLFYRAGDGVRIDMAQVSAANFEGPEAKRMMALAACPSSRSRACRATRTARSGSREAGARSSYRCPRRLRCPRRRNRQPQ